MPQYYLHLWCSTCFSSELLTERTRNVYMAVVMTGCGDVSPDGIGPLNSTPESTKAMKTDSNI